MIDIHYNYGPGLRGTTTQRRPKYNLRTLVALLGLQFNIDVEGAHIVGLFNQPHWPENVPN